MIETMMVNKPFFDGEHWVSPTIGFLPLPQI
jgi:hypothetical protein